MHMFKHVDPFEAKYMVPRDPSLRACYRSSKIQRTKLSIHAAWCFGWVLRVVVLEEDTIHGSSMVHELVSLCLEDVMRLCQEKQVTPPDTAVLVGDNTVKELKNSCNLLYWAQLVQHNHLKFFGRIVCKMSFQHEWTDRLWLLFIVFCQLPFLDLIPWVQVFSHHDDAR